MEYAKRESDLAGAVGVGCQDDCDAANGPSSPPCTNPLHPTTRVERFYRSLVPPKDWKAFATVAAGRTAWPGWCWVPSSECCRKIFGEPGSWAFDRAMPRVRAFVAVATWRLTKGIYRFDPDLANALANTAVDGPIPVEVLFRLPEWCVFVETPPGVLTLPTELGGDAVEGFFAYLDHGCPGNKLIIMAVTGGDSRLTFYIPLEQGRLVRDLIPEAVGVIHGEDRFDVPGSMLDDISRPLLPLLMYLCAQNADFGTAGRPTRNVRRGKKGKALRGPEPKVWEVGVRIGAALRRAQATHGVQAGGGTHASPRPHVRRAHWHHFWAGPRTAPQLVVHWLPPILVGDPAGNVAAVRAVGGENGGALPTHSK